MENISFNVFPIFETSWHEKVKKCKIRNLKVFYTNLKIPSKPLTENTAQKMKLTMMDFFSKCDRIRRFLRIWSHLLRKSLMENFIFCAVKREGEALPKWFFIFNQLENEWQNEYYLDNLNLTSFCSRTSLQLLMFPIYISIKKESMIILKITNFWRKNLAVFHERHFSYLLARRFFEEDIERELKKNS